MTLIKEKNNKMDQDDYHYMLIDYGRKSIKKAKQKFRVGSLYQFKRNILASRRLEYHPHHKSNGEFDGFLSVQVIDFPNVKKGDVILYLGFDEKEYKNMWLFNGKTWKTNISDTNLALNSDESFETGSVSNCKTISVSPASNSLKNLSIKYSPDASAVSSVVDSHEIDYTNYSWLIMTNVQIIQ